MPNVLRLANASIDGSTAQFAPQISGNLIAGENLDAVAPCRIQSDGRVVMTNGVANTAAARFDGFTARATKSGESVTLFGVGTRLRYGAALTPGGSMFAGTLAGILSDDATTGGLVAIARVISATDIRIIVNAA